MADAPEDEDLFVPAADEADQPDNQDTDPPADEGDAEEFEITLAGEEGAPAPDAESDRFRELRRAHRAQARELAELRAANAPKPKELGPRPTMEEHGYNAETYDEALLKWNADKADIESAAQRQQKEAEDRSAAWRKQIDGYEKKKAALPVRDFDAAEDAVTSTFSQIQQAVILEATDDPAKVIYALGKRPQRLAELAAITNPIKLAIALSKLEGTITVNTRKPPPEPEARVRGAAPFTPANTDKQMEKLEAEFRKTGDRTAIREYRAKLAERKTGRR